MIRNLKMKKTLYAFDFDHTILKGIISLIIHETEL